MAAPNKTPHACTQKGRIMWSQDEAKPKTLKRRSSDERRSYLVGFCWILVEPCGGQGMLGTVLLWWYVIFCGGLLPVCCLLAAMWFSGLIGWSMMTGNEWEGEVLGLGLLMGRSSGDEGKKHGVHVCHVVVCTLSFSYIVLSIYWCCRSDTCTLVMWRSGTYVLFDVWYYTIPFTESTWNIGDLTYIWPCSCTWLATEIFVSLGFFPMDGVQHHRRNIRFIDAKSEWRMRLLISSVVFTLDSGYLLTWRVGRFVWVRYV